MLNPFKPHIVKFKDGTYGIRKLSLYYTCWVFLDLRSNNEYWWEVEDEFFSDCQTLEKPLLNIRIRIERLKSIKQDNGTPC